MEVHGPLTIDVRDREEAARVPGWLIVALVAIAAVVVVVVVALAVPACGSVWIDLAPDGEDGEDLVDGDAGEDLVAEDLADGDAGDGEQLVDVEDLADAGEDLAPEDLDGEAEACGPSWWWADVDGDGFGAGDPLSVECGVDPPGGYVDRGGDCCDTAADVKPDQLAWFTTAHVCPGLEPFDYDCDGAETLEVAVCVVCGSPPSCSVISGAGGDAGCAGGTVPHPCGSGMWLGDSCLSDGSGCVPILGTLSTQGCR